MRLSNVALMSVFAVSASLGTVFSAPPVPEKPSNQKSQVLSVQDMEKLVNSMSGMSPSGLPKYADPSSQLKSVVDSIGECCAGADLRTKMGNCSKTLILLGKLTQYYVNAQAKGNNYNPELLYLGCANFQAASITAGSLSQMADMMDPNSPTYQSSMAGIESMKAQMSRQLLALNIALAPNGDIDDDLRNVASRYLVDFGKAIVDVTPTESKKDIQDKFKAIAGVEKNRAIKARIETFLTYF